MSIWIPATGQLLYVKMHDLVQEHVMPGAGVVVTKTKNNKWGSTFIFRAVAQDSITILSSISYSEEKSLIGKVVPHKRSDCDFHPVGPDIAKYLGLDPDIGVID